MTKWDDIVAVDTDHTNFSSAQGISLQTREVIAMAQRLQTQRRGAGFITMDEPQHGPSRKAVSPAMAPTNVARMAPQIRERAWEILDALPIGEPFDWADRISKELTAMTLATLFDFPFEDRRMRPRGLDPLPGLGCVGRL